MLITLKNTDQSSFYGLFSYYYPRIWLDFREIIKSIE